MLGINQQNEISIVNIASDEVSVLPNRIPYYRSAGNPDNIPSATATIPVCTPVHNDDAANKKYVDDTVAEAGGFIIQLMPFATEEAITKLENNLKEVTSVTKMLDAGLSPEEMLDVICKDLNPVITDTIPVGFKCNCSFEKVSRALISVGKADLQKMADEGESINLHCDFCNTDYEFTHEDLVEMLKYAE